MIHIHLINPQNIIESIRTLILSYFSQYINLRNLQIENYTIFCEFEILITHVKPDDHLIFEVLTYNIKHKKEHL